MATGFGRGEQRKFLPGYHSNASLVESERRERSRDRKKTSMQMNRPVEFSRRPVRAGGLPRVRVLSYVYL